MRYGKHVDLHMIFFFFANDWHLPGTIARVIVYINTIVSFLVSIFKSACASICMRYPEINHGDAKIMRQIRS